MVGIKMSFRGAKKAETSLIFKCTLIHIIDKMFMIVLCFRPIDPRMDADQTARRLMRETLKRQDADYYEFEGHVFFDDCMEILEDWEEGGPGKIPNQFVQSFVSVIDQVGWK